MDEIILKREARFYALEYMVMNLYANLHRLTGQSLRDTQRRRDQTIERLSKETFPGFDAAESDLVSQEIVGAVQRLLLGIEEIMEKGSK